MCGVCSVTLALAEQGHRIEGGIIHDNCRLTMVKSAASLTGRELSQYLPFAGGALKLKSLAASLDTGSLRLDSHLLPDAAKGRAMRSGNKSGMSKEDLVGLIETSIDTFHRIQGQKYLPAERAIVRKVEHLLTALKNGWIEVVALS